MAEKKTDQFANYAIIRVDESAANTLTFKKLETGISLSEKVAWVINRLEYFAAPLSVAQFNADQDQHYFGISVGNSFALPSILENTIIDYNHIMRVDVGAAASGGFLVRPLVKDFSQLPGGGILVPPVPVYLYTMGQGLVGVSNVTVRMHYTLLQLSVDQYWELVEARRVIGS